MKADAKTEAEVMSTLRKLVEGYKSRHMDSVLSCYAPDPDLVYIGTGVDEKRIGLDEVRVQLERDLAQSEAISIELGWNSVSAAGSVAWVAGEAIVHAKASGQEISFSGRFTFVLEQRKGRWLIVHRHFSVPSSKQAEGESLPMKQ